MLLVNNKIAVAALSMAMIGPIYSTAAATETPILAETVEAGAIEPAKPGGFAVALRDSGADGEILGHYETAEYPRIWTSADGDARRAEALLAALRDVEKHALPTETYDIARLEALLAAAIESPAKAAAAEVALTKAFLTYARAINSGVLEPRRIDRDLHVFPTRPEPADLLSGAAASRDMSAFLADLAPKHPHYAVLTEELARLNVLGEDAWGGEVASGGSIRLGERGARVEAIRERLAALGDYDPSSLAPDADSAVYDEGLEAAVLVFQHRHGLNDDGIIGRRTVDALNRSADYRAGQIVVNLERLRWMNRDLGARHVFVNQADYTVQVIENGLKLFDQRVVIGQAREHRTPEFSDEMTHLVFNPTWHVPYSIASKEILPELQADPDYLNKKNMRLLTRGGEEVNTSTFVNTDAAYDEQTEAQSGIDWSLYTASDFPFLIKQRPGGGNSLGLVKFMFPNQFNIYLHDTPSKRLFAKDARAFSHGCVRVQDPMELARVLLAPQAEDAPAYIQRILGRDKERRVNLEQPVPVHLTYRTAWIDEAGVRHYRADIYGRDRRILAALKSAGVMAGPDS
ncbi:MAG: L,D-transpeptidase family protein [Pseudomonadota bacterium]